MVEYDEWRAQFVETHLFQAFLEDRMRVALGGLARIPDWPARAAEPLAEDGAGGAGPDNESELLSRCAERLTACTCRVQR